MNEKWRRSENTKIRKKKDSEEISFLAHIAYQDFVNYKRFLYKNYKASYREASTRLACPAVFGNANPNSPWVKN